MPSGYDAEVAELFRDLRAATTLSETDLAARIGTRPEVVLALEQGVLNALPPWAETCRVVNAYGTLLNLDVRPLLRRIYAQLEAGIVELQPKPMPEVPTMTPRDTGDFGFPSGSAAGAAPNPLDIPWPPAAAQQPQMPRPNPAPSAAPQASRPNPAAFPQPQNARPQVQARPQQPQAWPGQQPMPQAFRPNAPAPRPAPQQAPSDRRPPQPHVGQPPQPQPRPSPPRPAATTESERLKAAFGPVAAPAGSEPATKKPRAFLKWGIVALVVTLVAAGLGLLYVYAPGSHGHKTPETVSTDPTDPRSKKADRLPDPTRPQPAAPAAQ